MKITLLLFVSHLFFHSLFAQTATDLIELESPKLDETSGLLFYNNKIITFNDSGGNAELYEVDLNSGDIIRTIVINNALNIDWEDITQDDDFIYIGDFGNNTGDRTDLKIYRISKADYNNVNNSADADIISFTYEDQTDFSTNPNTNFDAEALISIGSNLMIFSKNWGDNMVKAYSIPKVIGTYNAILESSYNVNGLITGADISPDEKTIFLVGYLIPEPPFMYTIKDIPSENLDVFSNSVLNKYTDITPLGNQIEGIALFETTTSEYKLYLSNEKFIAIAGPITIPFPPKLWLLEIEDSILSIDKNQLYLDVNTYPNPTIENVKLSALVDEVTIYDAFGNLLIKSQMVDELSIENLKSGVYFLYLKLNNSITVKKIIKR